MKPMRLGIAVLRVVVGALFMGHGLQKLTGWFGGHGVEGTGQAFDSMGMHPGKANATLAGTAETLGGGLLLTGFLTPVGASAVTGVMAVAVAKVHGRNGPWVTNNGYEYNLALTAAAFAVATDGPGMWSLDERLGIEHSGPAVGLAELATGLAGAAAVVKLSGGRSQQPAAATPPAEQPGQATHPRAA
jgi:putative oxidoreductase